MPQNKGVYSWLKVACSIAVLLELGYELLERRTSEVSLLKLLLFVDDRPAHRENIREVLSYLRELKEKNDFRLDIVETAKQPHLVEYFKLVATPALVKTEPQPRQTLAGSNLVAQLDEWWTRWQDSLEQEGQKVDNDVSHSEVNNLEGEWSSGKAKSGNYPEESIRLADEVFRLEQEKEELLEQLNFKDQALAMLVHDLRSPLTAASLAMETLEISELQEDSLKKKQLRKQIFKQSRRQFAIMKRMIDELLESSRSINARLEVRPHQLNLGNLCREMVTQYQEQTQAKSLTIEQDIPQDIPPVYADEELLRQLLANLLDNAFKYTPNGGKITLSVLHRTSQKVQVSISDNGPGIPPEKQERIFERDYRLERDEKQEGYGLGLALCRRIARAHYSSIWVDSAPNMGSTFHFTLPVYR